MRSGQVWSIDLVLSLVLFGGAMLLAFTLATNTLQEDGYREVKEAARGAAQLLASEGYPEHWSSDTVIRTGLAADGHVSLRKAREMAQLSDDELRAGLRLSTPAYVYAMDASGEVVPIFDGMCGVGDLTVASSPDTIVLPAAGFALATKDVLDAITNITVEEDDVGAIILENVDVLIVEGNLTSTVSSEGIAGMFARAARRGMTIVFLGDPGVAMLGLAVNGSNATSVQLAGDAGSALGFTDDALINVSLAGLSQSIPTIELPSGGDVSNARAVGTTDLGKIAIASWTYDDAHIWYVATMQGENATGNNLTAIIAPALQSMIVASWPECSAPAPPADAKNVAHHDRVLPHHDALITIRTLVWRNN